MASVSSLNADMYRGLYLCCRSTGITINNDKDFTTAISAILKRAKDCLVAVEFDVDVMEGFRISKRASFFNIL